MFSSQMIEEAHRTLGLSTSQEAIRQKYRELQELFRERREILEEELTQEFLAKIAPRTAIDGEERLMLLTRVRNRAINEAIQELINEPVMAVLEQQMEQETEEMERELLQ